MITNTERVGVANNLSAGHRRVRHMPEAKLHKEPNITRTDTRSSRGKRARIEEFTDR